MVIRRLAAVEQDNRGIEDLKRQISRVDAKRFVELTIEFFGPQLVMTTSFGIHSALMLYLITRVKPDIPVIWIDTGYLFPETYQFADEMAKRLNLNLKVYQSDLSPARMEALEGRLWAEKTRKALDRYHLIRKVEPLQRAFRDLNVKAWFSGLRSEQTDYRRSLERVHEINGRYQLLPILHWDADAVEAYLKRHNLPSHPLREKGYVSIGDWHSSRRLAAGDRTDRETRFHGLKQECGIHLPLTSEAEESLRSSGL